MAHHEGLQHFWYPNRAVLLLVLLQDGDDQAGHGARGGVERVRPLGGSVLALPRAHVKAAGLVICAVGSTGNLAEAAALVGRQPRLDVKLRDGRGEGE